LGALGWGKKRRSIVVQQGQKDLEIKIVNCGSGKGGEEQGKREGPVERKGKMDGKKKGEREGR